MEHYHQPRHRRRKTNGMGCTCDCNYARSLQGICKIVQLVLLGLAWIIIAASPYWRPIFVIGGETWPFHIVMLFSIVSWLSVLSLYCLFMSGYHLSQAHRNWPKVEFYFNIVMCIFVLIAACLEAANVWRWDMMNGNRFTGGSAYSSYYQYGLRPGMSFTQTLNFNSYCATRPYDCTDYFNLLAGNNSYYTNHLFSVVLLFFALIAFLVSTFFAYKTLRVFERDMYRPGELPKPTMWMRFTYQMEKAGNHVREKAGKVFNRGNADEKEEDSDDAEAGDIVFEDTKKTALDVESGFDEKRYDDGRSSRAKSHSSHHTSRSHRSHGDHRSKSRSSHRDENGRSSRHEGSERSSKHRSDHGRSSRSSSEPRSHGTSKQTSPLYEVPPPYEEEPPLVHPQPVGAFPVIGSKKGSKKSKKGEPPVDMSPVASVMI